MILCARTNKAFDFKLLEKWVRMCVCVCLCHLNRYKTCTFAMSMRIFKDARGWSVLQMSLSNEDVSLAQWYGLGTLNPRTRQVVYVLDIYNFIGNGNRLSPEPAYRYVFFAAWQLHMQIVWSLLQGREWSAPMLLGIHWCRWMQFVHYRHSTSDCTVLSCQVKWCCLRKTHSNFTIQEAIISMCVCVVNTFGNTGVWKIGQYRHETEHETE